MYFNDVVFSYDKEEIGNSSHKSELISMIASFSRLFFWFDKEEIGTLFLQRGYFCS
jgi:aspartyl aminopeptidase